MKKLIFKLQNEDILSMSFFREYHFSESKLANLLNFNLAVETLSNWPRMTLQFFFAAFLSVWLLKFDQVEQTLNFFSS